MKKVKIGFLPLYIKLYDDCGSGAVGRPRLEPFYERLACELESRGFEVIRNEFCRIKPEFAAAVEKFEKAGADCIVTWHAAYSPSLESIDALAGTSLPIIVLDTTETYDFSPAQNPAEISFCHGIHGVMDMCSLLRQRGKAYAVCAGHIEHSNVLDKVAGYVKAAGAARALAGSRAGSVGGSFDGMGDFLIDDETWIYTAITFLVISCPCALVLSVPLAFFSGIGVASKKGILFKGGVAIETLPQIKAVVMDKTGTITKGNTDSPDCLKDDSKSAITNLKARRIKTVMLTGDTKERAEAIAKEAGVEEVYARLLPQDKLKYLQEVRERYGKVMFVGDGINDAPALAGADVGAAMASGTDAAVEAADVVFMASSMQAIPDALEIAKTTNSISMQNVVFALGIKALVMVLGLFGFANMWMAVFADTGVAMLCVLNSVRILKRK